MEKLKWGLRRFQRFSDKTDAGNRYTQRPFTCQAPINLQAFSIVTYLIVCNCYAPL